MLGIDSILGLVTSIEKLTDTATEGSPSNPDKQNGVPQRLTVEREHCIALIDISWSTILDILSQLLARTNGEALIVQLLKVHLLHFVNTHSVKPAWTDPQLCQCWGNTEVLMQADEHTCEVLALLRRSQIKV